MTSSRPSPVRKHYRRLRFPKRSRRLRSGRGRGRTGPLGNDKPSDRASLPYQPREVLLSQGERAFYHALRRAVAGRCPIMCKVRLADIVTCDDAAWAKGYGWLIARQHVDFVLCDPFTMKVRLAIELDDRSHARPKRQKRDQFFDKVLAAAGVPLLRVTARACYRWEQIQDHLRPHLV